MDNTLIDNSENLKMVDVLKELIQTDGIDKIRIATGYWDLPGLMLVAKEIRYFLEKDKNNKLFIIIGKDPYVYADMVKNVKYKDATLYPQDFIRIDLDDLKQEIKEEHLDSVNLLIEFIENSQIEIRIFKTNEEDQSQFFHSKSYIFTKGDDEFGAGIIGSSNFTKNGLCHNSELNYLETNSMIVCYKNPNGTRKGHVKWFDDKWELATNWNNEFLEQVLKKSKIGQKLEKKDPEPTKPEPIEPLSPKELYIKFLQTYFGDIADPNKNAVFTSYLPNNYEAFDYQFDAVKQCFFMLKQYGGFILGDVVGLGKTVVASLIIKEFLYNANRLKRESKALVIAPPSIMQGWKNTLKDFEIINQVDFITTGSINKLNPDEDVDDDNIEALNLDANYGIILIDESHNFRNSETNKYKDLDTLIFNIANKTGYQPYIGLLSATPQNNSPKDLYNQIRLFQRQENKSNIPGIPDGKLRKFFDDIQAKFMLLRKELKELYKVNAIINKKSIEEKVNNIREISQIVREKVLNHITVRRTRTDIRKYKDNKLKFPTIGEPHILEYKLKGDLPKLFSDTVDAILNKLSYARYTALKFFVDVKDKRLYSTIKNEDATEEAINKNIDDFTERLANIMRILLVKRFESSFDAFRESLVNFKSNIQIMIDMLQHDKVFICPDLDVNNIYRKNNGENNFDNFVDIITQQSAKANERNKNENKKENNKKYNTKAFSDDYIEELKKDLSIVDNLISRWENQQDPKLQRFIKALSQKNGLFDDTINNPHHYNNEPQKLVIFTEAVATLKALQNAIENDNDFEGKVLCITGENRKEKQKVIQENFDANYKGEFKNDYNIIITTDVLAEGINLHRSNVILNYDEPWNSTRLMQRIGRVNRIGSKEDQVHVFNFKPTGEGENQIGLIAISLTKLQSFHTLFGEDNKIFLPEEQVEQVKLSNLVEGGESTLLKYILEPKEYQKNNPDRYNQILNTEFKDNYIYRDLPQNQIICKGVALVCSDNKAPLPIYIDEYDIQRFLSLETAFNILNCDNDTPRVDIKDNELIDTVKKSVENYYNSSCLTIIRGGDIDNKQKIALEYLTSLKMQAITMPKESQKKFREITNAVKYHNNDAITLVYNLKNENGLFSDLEMLIMSVDNLFDKIKNKVKADKGETIVNLICLVENN